MLLFGKNGSYTYAVLYVFLLVYAVRMYVCVYIDCVCMQPIYHIVAEYVAIHIQVYTVYLPMTCIFLYSRNWKKNWHNVSWT